MNALLLALTLASSSASTPVQVAKETVIVVHVKHMTCGAPRGLQNDAVQTVRVCEFK